MISLIPARDRELTVQNGGIKPMGYLLALNEYLNDFYNTSIFDQALASKKRWKLHVHNHCLIKAEITQNLRYDLGIKIDGEEEKVLPKVSIKLVYPDEQSDTVTPLLKKGNNVEKLTLEPIMAPKDRYHIKNKTLFPLMKERRVVFFTLLEGEIIRGLIVGFSRYEITIDLKGAIPITILRHSIYDLRDKKGRCFLKSFQQNHRDWEKSDLFVSSPP